MNAVWGVVVGCLLVVGCSTDDDPVERWTVEVVATHPHDDTAYTQGLLVTPDGRLFESTGRYGQSELRELDLETGRVVRRAALDPELFGEGLAVHGDELVQLTWREGVALRWGVDDLVERGRRSFDGEGWGLATDGDSFLQSSGGSRLVRRDVDSFEVVEEIDVTLDGEPVDQLNELEVVDGTVLANVFTTTDIVMVDPGSGRVTGVVDASSLVPEGLSDPGAVLNGIAHRPGDPSDRLLVTGKLWPVLYEVRLVPA